MTIIYFIKYNLNKKTRQIFNIILLLVISLIFQSYDNYRRNNLDDKHLKIKEFEDLNGRSFLENIFYENPIQEIKEFREYNEKNILYQNLLFQKNEHPAISVIVTVYNQANCFYKTLRSIQNQSFKNIEIIIIDDCSLDNTTEIIEKYMIEDKRIIYIKNESNNGKIKSRSDGIRISKGKYITIVDGDDILSHKNVLYNCFSIAEMADLDVVEFRYGFFEKKNFIKLNFNLNNIKNINNRIIYQPELATKFIDLVGKDNVPGFSNRCIWGKLIKTSIFKKVLLFIGSKYTEDYLLDFEDTIMTVALFNLANSYYYINELGYYKSYRECENPFPILNYKKCVPKNITINKEIDAIKYINFLLDKLKTSEINYNLIYKELKVIDHVRKLDKIINKNFSYVYSILDKIINISSNKTNQKLEIIRIKNKLIEKEKNQK